MIHQTTSEQGFTLIETIVGLGILAIGIMALYTMQSTSVVGNGSAYRLTSKANWAADQIESLVGIDYDDNIFNDTDGDGTDQDSNGDGVDDDAGDFGLYDTGPAADGTSVTNDGFYSISWNVAIDHPMKNTKTVCVIITSNADNKSVAYKYIKADPI